MPTNYSTLIGGTATTGSIKAWTNKADTPSDQILDEAQAAIYRLLRVREMQAVYSGTVTASATSLVTPTDYLGDIDVRFIAPDDYPLNRLTPAQLEVTRPRDTNGVLSTGAPSNYAVYGTNFQFDVGLDQARVYRILYWAEPEYLSLTNETNFLTAKGVNLLKSACLMKAAEWKQDMGEAQYWEGKMVEAAQALNAECIMESSNTFIPWVGY